VGSRLLTGENAVHFRGNLPPAKAEEERLKALIHPFSPGYDRHAQCLILTG
jgi:hypothetical protein